jgi:hypothetical protein
MQISIAMCTYNGEGHLQAQLDSIRTQTRAPFELVLCDDGSTDATPSLVEQFAMTVPFPVRLLRNPVNLGSTKNFEQAIQLCRGEVICLCDQDDLWQPDKLARMAAVLEQRPQAAGVFSNAFLIDDDGNRMPGDLWQRFGFTPARQRRFYGEQAPVQLVKSATVTGATLLFRSSWRETLLPISPLWVHDGWIALLLASMGELHALPVCTMSYRLHGAQQVGATQVPWQNHLSTPVEKARSYHRTSAAQSQAMLDRLEVLALRSPGRPPYPSALVEVRRKLRFVNGRAAILDRPPARRLLPALQLLPGYVRFERGILSLLRDLTHSA